MQWELKNGVKSYQANYTVPHQAPFGDAVLSQEGLVKILLTKSSVILLDERGDVNRRY